MAFLWWWGWEWLTSAYAFEAALSVEFEPPWPRQKQNRVLPNGRISLNLIFFLLLLIIMLIWAHDGYSAFLKCTANWLLLNKVIDEHIFTKFSQQICNYSVFRLLMKQRCSFPNFWPKKASQNITVYMVIDSKPLFSYGLQTLVCSSFSNLFTKTIISFLQISAFCNCSLRW